MKLLMLNVLKTHIQKFKQDMHLLTFNTEYTAISWMIVSLAISASKG